MQSESFGCVPDFKLELENLIKVSEHSTQEEFSIKESCTLSKDLLNKLSRYESTTRNFHERFGNPGQLARYWHYSVFGLCLLGIGINRLSFGIIRGWVDNSVQIVKSFVSNWIIQPLLDVYETIRYKDNNLSVLGAESLASDLEVYIYTT